MLCKKGWCFEFKERILEREITMFSVGIVKYGTEPGAGDLCL
jgi:hypothetical protein